MERAKYQLLNRQPWTDVSSILSAVEKQGLKTGEIGEL